ncbi:MAG: hypothetical protein C0403_13915 [Desulfobacterium sp.]|nr:hypothetical protein [Desulfobacterium sp.]
MVRSSNQANFKSILLSFQQKPDSVATVIRLDPVPSKTGWERGYWRIVQESSKESFQGAIKSVGFRFVSLWERHLAATVLS